MKRLALVGVLVASATAIVVAQKDAVGTWKPRDTGKDDPIHMVMVISDAGDTRTITYRSPERKDFVMTVVTKMDGEDSPVLVNGKPTGQTMAIKRTGPRMADTILKFNGKVTGKSHAELSADGKVLKIEDEITAPEGGRQVGKRTTYWDKQ